MSFRIGARVPAGAAPGAIVAGDFDGDGQIDLAVANYQSNNVSILLGDSASGFTSPTYYTVGTFPSSIAAADFNGDGRLDLVTANNNSANISILLGAGAGSFNPAINYATAPNPSRLVTADFNGDNLSDIAVGSTSASNFVAILLSNGAGGFNAATPLNAGGRVHTLTVGKFNDDGILDLAVGLESQSAVFIGDGSGGFGTANSLPSGFVVKATGDFNGDNKADLVGSNRFPAGIAIALGTGAGVFSAPTIYPGDAGGGIVVGDFDRDGKSDVAATDNIAAISILRGDGTGRLGAPSLYTVGNWATAIVSADFNADGKLDLAVASSYDSVTLLYGTTAGEFAGPRNFKAGSKPDEIALADFNGDGQDDLAVVNTGSQVGHPGASSISVMLGDGTGQMASAPTIQFQQGVTILTALVSADFNNDRKADLAVSAGGDAMHGVNVMLGNGDGTFAAPTNNGLRAFGGSAWRLVSADFNLDGNADIVVSFIHTGGFVTLLGTGAGTFTTVPGYSLGTQNLFEDFAVGDINRDGRPDLVFPRYHDKLLKILLGNGNGSFPTTITLTLPDNPLAVVVSDFNADGKADLAFTAASDSSNYHVTVRLGTGVGNFVAPTYYDVGNYPQSITTGDFDGDGKVDLVTSDSQSEQVSILSGDGAGGFNLSVPFVIGGYPGSTVVADFNRDGKVDLAVSRFNANSVAILLNDFTTRHPCISVDDVNVAEGDAGASDATFNITLSEASARTVRVNFRVEPRYVYVPEARDGVLPTAGIDFQPVSGTLTFAPGTTTQTIKVSINGDIIDEYDESISVILSSPANALLHDSLGIGKILDDDAPPNVSIDDSTVVEGTAVFPAKTAVFNVTLSAASAKPIEVTFQPVNGTAAGSSDYQVYNGTLSFAPGATAKTITIEIVGDRTYETDETFFVNLSGVVNAIAIDAQGLGTILNDDTVPVISIPSSDSVAERQSGTTDGNFTVQLSNATYQTVTVNYATADQTAVAGSDYIATSGSLTFNPGETSKLIKVPIIGDVVDEIDETFTLTLSGVANATPGNARMIGTIHDDDGPSISISDVSVLEGDSGQKNAAFTITLSAVSPQNVGAYFTAGGGTATAGIDYVRVLSNSFVSVPAGQLTATLNIQIIGDFRLEPDETFNVNLSNPMNGTLADSLGVGTILNDDAAGTLQLSAASYSVNEGAASATINVDRVGGRSGIVSVTFNTGDGTATAGSDYTAVNQTITFADGDAASKSITIPLADDSIVEAPETVNLTLSNPTNGAVLGSPAAGVLTIQDNDPCNYSINPAGKTSPAGGETVSVNVTAQGGCNWTAVSNSNFISVASGGSGTGNGVVSLTVSPNNSGVPRTGSATIAGQSFNITQPELVPEVPTLQFGAASYTVGEGEGRVTVTLTLTHNSAGGVSVDYRTTDTDAYTVSCADTENNNGGAFARCDFAASVGRINFAAGEVRKTITIPIINDGHDEGAETFKIVLSNAAGVAVLGAVSATTVTVQDDDPAGAANPIFTTPFFVRQQYLDFLSREPEANEPWSAVLNGCSDLNNNPACDRLIVSQSFFGSPEFQLKGFYVFRFYRLAFNRLPEYPEIISDMSFVAGDTPEQVYQRKAQLALNFTGRQEFQTSFGGLSHSDFVDALLARYGLTQITTPDPQQPDGTAKVTLTNADLVARLNSNAVTRAQVFRAVADSDQVGAQEYNNAFVGMQYYGYLRRKPEQDGFEAWLRVLRSGDVRTMVNGFMNSAEYKLRFGRP